MTYTVAALLGVAGVALVDLFVLRTRLLLRSVFWATYPIIVFFQLISNGILTGRNIVRYAPDAIIGWRLAYAPVEDLLFGFALVLLTLAIWVRLGRAGVQRTPAAGDGARLLRLFRPLDRQHPGTAPVAPDPGQFPDGAGAGARRWSGQRRRARR
ncbi:lycopene cyclase domain-containing protein [Plantactinospora sp. WMMC1484]|uniref:lycopene cyclase domain-containing protein n=1 Tax=Plantactinospora sp. WMMC1484 TaxID=3404122 RepID=UPI003BF4CEAA